MVRALDLRSAGCGFDYRPSHWWASILEKSFIHNASEVEFIHYFKLFFISLPFMVNKIFNLRGCDMSTGFLYEYMRYEKSIQ